MATRTMRINRCGNSLGIRFPSEFVDNVRLKEKSRGKAGSVIAIPASGYKTWLV